MVGSHRDRELDVLRVVLGMPMVDWQGFEAVELPGELRDSLDQAGRNQLQTMLVEVVGRLAERKSPGIASDTK